MSDSEAMALAALRSVDGTAVRGRSEKDVKTESVCSDWRAVLQEMRRKAPAPGLTGKGDADSLARLVRQALKAQSGTALAVRFQRGADFAGAVQQLETDEVVGLLRLVLPLFDSHPGSDWYTSAWVNAALENGGPDLLKHSEVLPVLSDFVVSLEQRLGNREVPSVVNSCAGKWRYIREMAAVRKETVGVTTSAPSFKKEESSDDEYSEDLKEEAGDEADVERKR